MRILILEDDGTRVNNFIELLFAHDLDITENAYEAVNLLESNVYDIILLDHDLGDGNGNGSIVSNFLRMNQDNSNYDAEILIHSWNAPASRGMLKDIPTAVWAPFNTEEFYDILVSGILGRGSN
jgi:CheY-like chemotaxis protein